MKQWEKIREAVHQGNRLKRKIILNYEISSSCTCEEMLILNKFIDKNYWFYIIKKIKKD